MNSQTVTSAGRIKVEHWFSSDDVKVAVEGWGGTERDAPLRLSRSDMIDMRYALKRMLVAIDQREKDRRRSDKEYRRNNRNRTERKP